MVEFLTDEWVDALSQAARHDCPSPSDALVIEYRVVDPNGDCFAYHLRIAPGAVDVGHGTCAAAALSLVTDRATAIDIARGELSAPAAFLAGRLHLEGDAMALVARSDALAELDDLFAAVREQTEY